MPTTVVSLFPPPLRDSGMPKPLQEYLFTLQRRLLLWKIDTAAGPYSEALPPAGLNSTTGQSNQNQEIVLKKISADANVYTFTAGPGAIFPEGPRTLVFQYDSFRVKSDGTNWWLLP
jgi:hypothetical protein